MDCFIRLAAYHKILLRNRANHNVTVDKLHYSEFKHMYPCRQNIPNICPCFFSILCWRCCHLDTLSTRPLKPCIAISINWNYTCWRGQNWSTTASPAVELRQAVHEFNRCFSKLGQTDLLKSIFNFTKNIYKCRVKVSALHSYKFPPSACFKISSGTSMRW